MGKMAPSILIEQYLQHTGEPTARQPADAGDVHSKALASHPGAKLGQIGSHDVNRVEPPTHHERKPGHTEVHQESRSQVQEMPLASSRSKGSVESSKAVPAAPPPTPRFSVPQRGQVRRREKATTAIR